jgi:hypothetical protein
MSMPADLDPRLAEIARLAPTFGFSVSPNLLRPRQLRVMHASLPADVLVVFAADRRLVAEIEHAWPLPELTDWLDPIRRTKALADLPLLRGEEDGSLRGWLGVRLARATGATGDLADWEWYSHWQITNRAMLDASAAFNARTPGVAHIGVRDKHFIVRATLFCPDLPGDLAARHLLGDALVARQIFELDLRAALRTSYARLRALSPGGG